MTDLKNKIAFVIATKDRPEELRRLLKSLENQTTLPEEVIVVDGSEKSVLNILDEFCGLNIKYLRCIPASGTRQRNLGIKAVDPSIPLTGFLDDDVEFNPDTIEKMIAFWERVGDDVGGASFNQINHPPVFASSLKYSFLFSKLSLYSNEKGKVLKSGFHTMIGRVDKTIYTEWISTCASVWRREVLERYMFDEWFEGYSYLEDLDFSYRVGKDWKLAVVADSKFSHHHSSKGRGTGFQFGKREIQNRLYFVRKNKELSVFSCGLVLNCRALISFMLTLQFKRPIYNFQRIMGNISGFIETF